MLHIVWSFDLVCLFPFITLSDKQKECKNICEVSCLLKFVSDIYVGNSQTSVRFIGGLGVLLQGDDPNYDEEPL